MERGIDVGISFSNNMRLNNNMKLEINTKLISLGQLNG